MSPRVGRERFPLPSGSYLERACALGNCDVAATTCLRVSPAGDSAALSVPQGDQSGTYKEGVAILKSEPKIEGLQSREFLGLALLGVTGTIFMDPGAGVYKAK